MIITKPDPKPRVERNAEPAGVEAGPCTWYQDCP